MSSPKENISPEERLLRIIKGQPKKEKLPQIKLSKDEIQPLTAEPKVIPWPAGRSAMHKERLGLPAALQRLNTGLFIFWCLLIAGIFAFVKNVFRAPQRYAITQDEAEVPQKGAAADTEKFPSRDFSEYAGIIGKRNLFKTYEAPGKTQAPAAQIAPSDLLGNYALAGVISGDNPQAIIEDKKTKATYFLNKGQLLGNFKIEEILEGKVILELSGERFELSL